MRNLIECVETSRIKTHAIDLPWLVTEEERREQAVSDLNDFSEWDYSGVKLGYTFGQLGNKIVLRHQRPSGYDDAIEVTL